ncbi:glycoside hydrolase family protein [Rhizobium sp. LEGMi135b]
MPINKLRTTPRAKALIASIVAATVAGYVAIFPGQTKVHDDTALAIKVAGPSEGRQLVAYLDTLPNPPRWTLCDGDTDDVKPYERATPAECDARIAKKMEAKYRPVLVACANIPNWDSRLLAWRGMMLSLAWNIGAQGACISTVAKLGGRGQYAASCIAATAFNKSGGRMYIGLAKRREMGDASRIGEGELCVSGL